MRLLWVVDEVRDEWGCASADAASAAYYYKWFVERVNVARSASGLNGNVLEVEEAEFDRPT